jgi:hypothetical protein
MFLTFILACAFIVWFAFSAQAQSTMYVCSALNPDGSCTAFVAALDGLATFEQIGITTESLGFAFGWGFGAVMLFFAIGLGLRSIRQVLEMALGGPST